MISQGSEDDKTHTEQVLGNCPPGTLRMASCTWYTENQKSNVDSLLLKYLLLLLYCVNIQAYFNLM